jgi:SAM-dependent methyltransferase
MLLNPHWLGRAYSKVIVPDPDIGALRRTFFLHRFLRRLRGAGLLPRHARSLDFGCGIGMLVRLERDVGVEAWGYDAYATPKFAETYCARELPAGQFDLVTCIEVLEHTTNPVEVLASFRSRVKDDGLVIVSTELVDRKTDANWHYLAKEHGQHITLFTRSGLDKAAETSGLERLRTVPFDGVPLLHLLVPKGMRPPAWKLLRLRLQQWVGESNFASDRRV